MKPHRFDTFAKKLAEPMMAAVRGALEVFSGDDRYHWPMKQLFGQLRLAEELARDMLREIAGKLFVSPMKRRIRNVSNVPVSPQNAEPRAPYFRLGLKIKNSPNAETCHPGQAQRGAEPGFRKPAPQPQTKRSYHPASSRRVSRHSTMCSPIPASTPRAWPARSIALSMKHRDRWL